MEWDVLSSDEMETFGCFCLRMTCPYPSDPIFLHMLKTTRQTWMHELVTGLGLCFAVIENPCAFAIAWLAFLELPPDDLDLPWEKQAASELQRPISLLEPRECQTEGCNHFHQLSEVYTWTYHSRLVILWRVARWWLVLLNHWLLDPCRAERGTIQ